MSVNKISEAILGVGVDDTTIDLFESQYPGLGLVGHSRKLGDQLLVHPVEDLLCQGLSS